MTADGKQPAPPDNAERIFTRVLMNLTRRHADMLTFRRLSGFGLIAAAETLKQENLDLANAILNDPTYDEFFTDRKAAVEFFGGPEAMATNTTNQELLKYSRIVDAGALVFVHSAVDAAVSDLCRATMLLDPASWERYVEATKVSLADAKEVGLESLLKEKLESYITALEKESIAKRIDRLFAICKPEPGYVPITGFSFDLERIKNLDETRHRIVHGEGYKNVATPIKDDLEFLVKSGLFLFAMVNMRYGVKVNPFYAVGIEPPVIPVPTRHGSTLT
jgi:hypothetical protein